MRLCSRLRACRADPVPELEAGGGGGIASRVPGHHLVLCPCLPTGVASGSAGGHPCGWGVRGSLWDSGLGISRAHPGHPCWLPGLLCSVSWQRRQVFARPPPVPWCSAHTPQLPLDGRHPSHPQDVSPSPPPLPGWCLDAGRGPVHSSGARLLADRLEDTFPDVTWEAAGGSQFLQADPAE